MPDALAAGAELVLPEAAARHVQVLRLQPGATLQLFNGLGGQWAAQVLAMGRREVRVRVLAHQAVEREAPRRVTLALAMPTNDRMDTLVEKATELGAAALVPLQAQRSVLRLGGDRAQARTRHWAAVAAAACEQCGRNRVPQVAVPQALADWLAELPPPGATQRVLLHTGEAPPLASTAAAEVLVLSGPEGGFTADELGLALAAGFTAVSLGPRTLRADTAPLAALVRLAGD